MMKMVIEVIDEKLVPSREKSRGLMVYRLVEALRLNGKIELMDSLELDENPRQALLPYSAVLTEPELNEVVRWIMPLVQAAEVTEVQSTTHLGERTVAY